MHTKERIQVTLDGRERTRTKVTCEQGGKAFVITHDGQTCPTCGQMFNALGQSITHKGY